MWNRSKIASLPRCSRWKIQLSWKRLEGELEEEEEEREEGEDSVVDEEEEVAADTTGEALTAPIIRRRKPMERTRRLRRPKL